MRYGQQLRKPYWQVENQFLSSNFYLQNSYRYNVSHFHRCTAVLPLCINWILVVALISDPMYTIIPRDETYTHSLLRFETQCLCSWNFISGNRWVNNNERTHGYAWPVSLERLLVSNGNPFLSFLSFDTYQSNAYRDIGPLILLIGILFSNQFGF